MILELENIAKVEIATVKIDGITIIAGENNTGKSTIGKVLFSIFNSFYKIEEQIDKERVENIDRTIYMMFRNIRSEFKRRQTTTEISEMIVNNPEKYRNNIELIKEELIDLIAQYDKSYNQNIEPIYVEEASERILDIINISSEEIFRTVLSRNLDNEFSGQINNIYNEKEGCIKLKIKNETVSIMVRDNDIEFISNKFLLNTEVIYIDDPFVLDELSYPRYIMGNNKYLDHRNHLKYKLFYDSSKINVINEILTTNKLEDIYSKINTICNGRIVREKASNFGYEKSGTKKALDIKNISAGLKTFVILKTLLENGSLEENGTIVLDEPEIHLHPEWQLIFAELIVLIQKEFGMHILLNTHSPYFLNAIEVYAEKYKITDKCNYYMAESLGEMSRIVDVTNNIELIYRKLARPLQELENERYRYD